jgi:hypothetical protein
MKVDLGHGCSLEPDEEPRNSPFHKRIVRQEPIRNTRAGHNVTLECGHGVQTFGDLTHAGGVVLCTKCRDLEEQNARAI